VRGGGGSKRFATDSLGMVRELNSATSASLAREAAVADVLRAFLMYGVIMDHFAGCADGATCRAVMEDIVWRQPMQRQWALMWLDTAVRMIGNYKAMAGFLMVSAYVDSGYAHATHLGRGDVVTLLTYLQMIWVLDPIVFAICSPLTPDRCDDGAFHYAGVHRWYLLLMLLIKLLLAAMRVARLPPLLQCVLVSVVAFQLPPELGCLTEERCESSTANDVDLWRGSLSCPPNPLLQCTREEDGLRTRLAPLWRLLFQGPYRDTWSMFSSILMRYYILFAVIYVWTFHYGRHAMGALSAATSRLTAGTDEHGRVFWRSAIRAAALVGLVLIELYNSAVLGPRTYNVLQENFMGTYSVDLLPTLEVLLLLVVAVVCLFAAVGVEPRPHRLTRLAGSTTLGCYVIHMYFTLALSFSSPHMASLPARIGDTSGLLVQLLWLFGAPLIFQLTIGVMFHKLLMLEMRLVLDGGARFLGRLHRLTGWLFECVARMPCWCWHCGKNARQQSEPAPSVAIVGVRAWAERQSVSADMGSEEVDSSIGAQSASGQRTHYV